MGLQLFFISWLFMVRFSNGFQLNDGNTLLNTVLVSDIFFIFVILRITAFPHAFVSPYISVLNVKVHEGYSPNYTYYHCSFASIFRLIRARWEISEFQKLIAPRKKKFEPKMI